MSTRSKSPSWIIGSIEPPIALISTILSEAVPKYFVDPVPLGREKVNNLLALNSLRPHPGGIHLIAL
jgi:hypothetical protein